jgi:hypothetical protein
LIFTLSAGVPKEKLILSIPTYGLSFLLENEDKYQIGDKISAQGLPGRVTNTTGILASYEVNHFHLTIFRKKDIFFKFRFANILNPMVTNDFYRMKVLLLLHITRKISLHSMIHNHYK